MTFAGPPPTGATRWRCWRDAASNGLGRRREGRLHGQRPVVYRRRCLGGGEPALRPARAVRSLRLEEYVRAGRVRILPRLPRPPPGGRLPRAPPPPNRPATPDHPTPP